MARRMQYQKLIKLEDIKEKMVLISESNTDYITPSGKVYKDYGNGLFYPKKSKVNNHNGYVYVGITCKNGKNKNRRLHRLLGEAFIPNPNPERYNIVGHQDNNKSNNNLDNLYWTNISENTKKAFDDKLICNERGISNCYSHPIAMFTNDGILVSVYGSIREAFRCISGFSLHGICHSCKYKTKGRKGYYFREITKNEYYVLSPKKLVFSIDAND